MTDETEKKLTALGQLKRAQAKAAPSGIVPTTRWYYGAWQFLLSYDAATHLWIFSAMLYPRGRGSVEADWTLLGAICAAVGVPRDSLMGNTIEKNANAVHKWAWTEAE